MNYCVVELRAMTATFRNPEFQNFHKTLHLPPPTTLVGLAGAALGKSPKAAQEYFERDQWHLGIWGTSEGYAKDLWKYRTLDSNPEKASSIVLREILFDNHWLAVFGCEKEDNVGELLEAFQRPVFALTMGSSDSLAKVVSVKIVTVTTENKQVAHCLVSGNVMADVQEHLFNGDDFSIYATSEPIAYDLPVRFQYETDYGVRRVVKRKTLSFIGEPMTLNFTVPGVQHGANFIPVFPLHEEEDMKKGQTTLDF
ncbi:MAG: CRISPR-associated protein Cas5 [Saprospiraceae bacterium]|nr:CRISPR-associated protein Cas5 [Saprospiraceae bacterium]